MSDTDSVLSTSYLHETACRFSFPQSAILAQPNEGDRACFPPSGFVTIYEDHLVSELRVPFPSIYFDIYEKYGISPTQIYPNGILQVTGLGVACKRLCLPFSVETFCGMFSFKARKGGWYFVSSRYLG